MALKMTYTDEGDRQGVGKALRITQPHEKRAGETGTLRHGNGADIGPIKGSLLEGDLRHPFNDLNVAARRKLGYHPAEAPVHVVLGRDDIGEHQPFGIKHRCSRFVTRGLDAEDGTRFPNVMCGQERLYFMRKQYGFNDKIQRPPDRKTISGAVMKLYV